MPMRDLLPWGRDWRGFGRGEDRDELAPFTTFHREMNRLFDDYKVAVIGFDVVFAEPDDSSGLKRLRQLAQAELKDQAGFAQRQVASQPFTHGRRRNTMSQGGHADGLATLGDVSHHFDSTGKGKSGILMDVHLLEFLESSGCVVTPSLSNSIQMNRYNLLELHT